MRICRRPASLPISGLRTLVIGRIATLTNRDGGTGVSGTAWELVLISGSLAGRRARGWQGGGGAVARGGGKRGARGTGKDETAAPMVTPDLAGPAGLAWPGLGL